jgi:hypothetical protein
MKRAFMWERPCASPAPEREHPQAEAQLSDVQFELGFIKAKILRGEYVGGLAYIAPDGRYRINCAGAAPSFGSDRPMVSALVMSFSRKGSLARALRVYGRMIDVDDEASGERSPRQCARDRGLEEELEAIVTPVDYARQDALIDALMAGDLPTARAV